MIPTDFDLSNGTLKGGPAEHYGTADDVLDLPVCRTDGGAIVSLWRPSWRERLEVALFGRVWLMVQSRDTHPPVSLSGRHTLIERSGRNG